jgi:acyl-CoA thioesterase FadM
LPKEARNHPVLFVDVDGVISLFGFPPHEPPGTFIQVDGIAHCISTQAGPRLQRLSSAFELVWATGWEDRANDHLPYLLKLETPELHTLTFDGRAIFGSAHWKVGAIDEYAGDRPAAWIDDNLDETCRAWAAGRSAPSLLVETNAAVGITDEHVEQLLAWAQRVAPPAVPAPPVFEQRYRVRFVDLDAHGELREAAIASYVEAARATFLRSAGADPHLERAELDYHGSAGEGDEIRLTVSPIGVEHDRVTLRIGLTVGDERRPLASAINRLAGPLSEQALAYLRSRITAA